VIRELPVSTTIEPLLAALIIFSTSTAYASTYHGIVQEIGISASGIRMSIQKLAPARLGWRCY
jgi:hypothetical protein